MKCQQYQSCPSLTDAYNKLPQEERLPRCTELSDAINHGNKERCKTNLAKSGTVVCTVCTSS